MVRRRLGLLTVLAAIGSIGCVAIVRAGPSRERVSTPHVPTVSAAPSTCFAAGSTCSIHPCVEFVGAAAMPRSGQSGVVQARRTRCASYPRPRGQTILIRR